MRLVPDAATGTIWGNLTKNRNGPSDAGLGFRVRSTELGVDEDGDQITAPTAAEVAVDADHAKRPKLTRAEQLAMLDLNVRALTDLSLRWLDGIARHKGGILNVASVAGFMPGPGMAVYYASKAYVISFTEALARELGPQGLRVTALCPGPVATEFQLRAGVDNKPPPWLLRRTADQVAQAGYEGFMAGKPIVIPGAGNRLMSFLPRLLSRGAMVRIIDKYQRGRGRRTESWKKRPKA